MSQKNIPLSLNKFCTKYNMRITNKRIPWDAETRAGERVFFKTFEHPDTQVCLGNFFKLLQMRLDVMFYLQLGTNEPFILFIPVSYWNKLLEFDFDKQMKIHLQIAQKFNDPEQEERWRLYKKAYSYFWKHVHPYFKLDFVKTNTQIECNLYMTYSDINLILDTLIQIDKQMDKQKDKHKKQPIQNPQNPQHPQNPQNPQNDLNKIVE